MRFLVLILLFFSVNESLAQESDQQIQDLIEAIIEDSEDNIDFDTFFETMSQFAQNPLNINKADEDDLISLGILTPQQVVSILKYRREVGELYNIYELQAIPHLDLQTVRRLAPFVKVKGELDDFNLPLKDLLVGGRHQLFTRFSRVLQEQKGYTPADTNSQGNLTSRYLGDQTKIYMRYKYDYSSKISYGFTAEKDAGEEFFKGSQKQGFDFYSAHFYLKDVGPFKQVIIGDYEMRLGQGLTVWNSLGFGKSAYVMNVKRQGKVIRPYTSVHEVNFLRGAAANLSITDQIDLTLFGSIKPIDVNVIAIDTLTDEIISISAIKELGAHRTASELVTKGAVSQTDAGAHLSFETRKIGIGLTASYNKYDKPIFRSDNPYNRFRFSGDRNMNFAIDYRALVGNLHFFGETAYSDQGGIATINGVLTSLHPTIDLSIVQRYYDRQYEAPYSNAFGESSTINNESGIFFGAEIRPIKNWKIRAYFDIYRHPWLRFRTDAPSSGSDKLLQIDYRPSRSLEIYGRIKSETKDRNLSGVDGPADILAPETKTGLRLNLRYKLTKEIALKSRVEWSWYTNSSTRNESGYMAFQEFTYKPLSKPYSFDVRFMLFETDSYESRIYTYEKDVLYAFSIPAYYDRGQRFYITTRYKWAKWLDMWLRFSQTRFENRDVIGGGLEEIDGSTKSEVKLQFRFKF